MSFEDFFNMSPRIIPLSLNPKPRKTSNRGRPRKQADMEKIEEYSMLDDSAFDFIGQGARGSGMMDSGFSMGGFGDKGFEDYISSAKGDRTGDFFAYIDSGAPKAFRQYGKESKKDLKQRGIGQDYPEIYGLESIGIGLERSEVNIGQAGKAFGKRTGKAYTNLKQDVKKFRHPEEGSILEKVGKKLQERKLKHQMRDLAELDEERSIKTVSKKELLDNPDIELKDTSGNPYSQDFREKYK